MPAVVRTPEEAMKETPVAFNRLRSQMMAFAVDVQGAQSPVWVDVMRVKRFKKAEEPQERA